MRFSIGALDLSARIIQSPLAGCSDLPFRLVARGKGLGFAYAEMVSAQSLTRDSLKTKRLLITDPSDRPLGAQLLGCDPGMMAEGAAILEEMGFDLLDLNLGCPVKKVVSNGEGSALLRSPEKAELIFRAVRGAVKKIPLTVKMRTGFSDPSGDEAVELARRAEAAGFDAVTVHGRTQAQQYGGRANWEAIGKVKRAVKIPVIGNGDVLTPEDARRLLGVSGCDAVMIGRGGLGNPWIYKNLEEVLDGKRESVFVPSVLERKETLLAHFALERERLGERQAALNMRRIAVWYTQGLPYNKAMRVAVCSTLDCGEIRRVIAGYFDGLPEAVPPPAVPVLLTE
ncbi:MAG: tRNA dihydrouridine synthase DusB [Elusimicrobia bacterium RBG_16_66_12]|nr:MAG: tRNA dihydrouridine synthase DusB [Elusimicrobia bacterium RBG_16_66_12]